MDLETLPAEHMIDEYTALAYRALCAAEQLYPCGRYYVAEGDMDEVPVLCELPEGEIYVVRYHGHK